MQDNSQVAAHFDRRSSVYDSKGTWVSNPAVLAGILDSLPMHLRSEPSTGVDIGAGTGAVAKYLVDHGILAAIVAIDLSKEMLSQIRDPRITTLVANVERTPCLTGSFDWGVSRQCLHYVSNLSQAAREIRRVLVPGGTFVLAQIVPFDEDEKEEWRGIVRLRQPLAPNLLSEEEWILSMQMEGLDLVRKTHVSHRSSTDSLAPKHRKEGDPQVALYLNAMANASGRYARNHRFETHGDSLSYDAFWSVMVFAV